jgi:hypothetical protein
MDLLKRRQAVLDANKQAMKTRESGWHTADGGADKREKAGEPPLDERPIVLQHDDEMHVCGPCVQLVQTAAKKVLDAVAADPCLFHTEQYTAKVVKTAKKALECKDEIVLTTQEWNLLNHGLAHVGCLCCSAAAVVPEGSAPASEPHAAATPPAVKTPASKPPAAKA